jgi:acyl transferase domain-containing protein/acyl carrier protein
MSAKDKPNGMEIAIIGMSGAFPGAPDLATFWDNLKEGVESLSFSSLAEDAALGVPDELLKNPAYVFSRGGVLSDKDAFDAPVFGYTDREASLMDPQIRIFHEHAYKALEEAGYNPYIWKEVTGLYAASSSNFYWQAGIRVMDAGNTVETFANESMTNKDFLATRVAYKLNLKGPAVTVNTACSSSLVALHLACRALLMGECAIALAGAVSASLEPRTGYLYREGMILSADGRCRAFDAAATGTIGGEGIGVVVLKRLKQALEDGDHIHAVIKGSAINNDGLEKAGYSAPAVEGQAAVIRNAIRIAGVAPESISYIEAHGTGTVLGDPIELKALSRVFYSGEKGYYGIGSVKTNIGHLDVAAGIAGLIKTVLSLKNRLIPPSVHYNKPNPKLELAGGPFYVTQTKRDWEEVDGRPLRAGVSSFGIGGTNAHVVLEVAPKETANADISGPCQLMVLSAHTEKALHTMIGNLLKLVEDDAPAALSNMAYTLATGRKEMRYRWAMAASHPKALKGGLRAALEEPRFSLIHGGGTKIVFMFPGQGSQYPDMGLDLYRNEPYFRKELDECFTILGWEVSECLYPEVNDDHASRKMSETEKTQPILFAFEYCLARLLIHWGLVPDALIGHSLGEYVAAAIAGVITLQDALLIMKTRGRLMQQSAGGAMVSVRIPESELEALPLSGLSVSSINTRSDITLGGTPQDIEVLCKVLENKGYAYSRLEVSHAFHSALMEPVLDQYEHFLRGLEFKPPRIPIVSNVTGSWITSEQAVDPAYWRSHLRQTVNFSAGIGAISQLGKLMLYEVGPGRTLSNFSKNELAAGQVTCILPLIRHPKQKVDDLELLLSKIGEAWKAGVRIDWQKMFAGRANRRLSLPTYPFEKHRYVSNSGLLDAVIRKFREESDAGRKAAMADWFYVPLWQQSVLPAAVADGSARTLVIVRNMDMPFLTRVLPKENEVVVLTSEGQNADSLFRRLREEDRVPDHILYLCCGNKDEEPYEQIQCLVSLLQGIGRQCADKRIQLILAGSGMFSVSGTEQVWPSTAALIGVIKVASVEYTQLNCRCVDLEPSIIGTGKAWEFLEAELYSGNRELIIAYRGEQRLVPIYLPKHSPLKGTGTDMLRRGGVYLITGGLGGMGLTLAKYLAEHYAARLILIGRSEFPSQDRWRDRALARDSEMARKIGILEKCREIGSELEIISGDIADSEIMAPKIAAAIARLGPVEGVLHCAGLPDHSGVIQRRTKDGTRTVISPKVGGLLTLERLFQHSGLRFFINFSSLGNVLYKYKYGQVGYNCANEFLDAYAMNPGFGEDTFVSSINWDDWSETGMAVKTVQKRLENGTLAAGDAPGLLKDAITGEEGVGVFLTVLQHRLKRAIISTTGLHLRIAKMVEEAKGSRPGHTVPGRNGHRMERTLLNKTEIAGDLETAVSEIFAEFLGQDNILPDEDFFAAGGDSLKAIHLIALLNDKYQMVIPLEIFFTTPTVRAMVNYMRDQRPLIPELFTFNSRGSLDLYCFPPAIAFGIAYKKLAEQIPGARFHAFNFVGNDERYDHYLQQMTSIQPKGPFVLLGYSAGGSLAFEMAKLLEERGYEVSDLFLLDTYRYRRLAVNWEALVGAFSDIALAGLSITDAVLREDIRRQIRDYYCYANTLVSKGTINSRIHLIRGTDRSKEEAFVLNSFSDEQASAFPDFRGLTRNTYIEYDGYGVHADMLDGANLKKNAAIVAGILEGVGFNISI